MSFQDVDASHRRRDTRLVSRSEPTSKNLFVRVDGYPTKRQNSPRSVLLEDRYLAKRSESPVEESDDDRESYDGEEFPPSTMAVRNKSKFAKLNSEIVHFQKMVRKLRKILELGQRSPENQWKSRIIFRSLSEADIDIWRKLQEEERNMQKSEAETKALSAHQKLVRDYHRIHDIFERIASENNFFKEDDDIPAPIEWLDPEQIQEKMMQQEKEDFFERAMREREGEINGINQSMRMVNEIYNELGRIVHTQQDQIDTIEDNIRYARAGAECGNDHLKRANGPSCFDIAMEGYKGNDPDVKNIEDSDFRWSMPFETLKEDMKSVQRDLIDLGRDILLGGAGEKPMLGPCSCSSNVVDNSFPAQARNL